MYEIHFSYDEKIAKLFCDVIECWKYTNIRFTDFRFRVYIAEDGYREPDQVVALVQFDDFIMKASYHLARGVKEGGISEENWISLDFFDYAKMLFAKYIEDHGRRINELNKKREAFTKD